MPPRHWTPDRLHFARTRANLTMMQLGELLGVSESAVSRWEAGSRPIPLPISKLLDYVLGTRKKDQNPSD